MPNILFIICILISIPVFADVPENQVKEVEHLLEFVKYSDCVIDRNGTRYPAVRAFEHIQKKYDYFRDDINNTEEFIEYSATKSTMSGKYYTVTCAGEKTVNTSDWLITELKRFRSGKD
jgi:hypothetical protein